MNDILKIKVRASNLESFLKMMWHYEINLYKINYKKDYIICNIYAKDLEKLKKMYKVKIIKDYSYKNILYELKKKYIIVIFFFVSLMLFLLFSNTIIDVRIMSNNKELIKNLTISLDNYNIKRLTLKKDFPKLQEIKQKLLDEYKDSIEWLEIENIGMTYIIKLEERKKENIEINSDKCNVIATTDGIITKIISEQGQVLVKQNSLVKEGDMLITGHITLNEEDKGDFCAKGDVYAEKWYQVEIVIPTTYERKTYTGKKRNNILIEWDNRDFLIFKSRLKNFDSDKNLVISLLGKKIYSVKEYEYRLDTLEYQENELDTKINDLITEKLELSLSDKERILQKNILKKEVNDSKIRIELFVTVEKLISKQVSY